MEQINQNFNNKYQFGQFHPAFKENETQLEVPEVALPDIYYTPSDTFEKKSFKETIKQADMMGMVSSYIDHPFLTFGTWLGCGFLMDRFAEACNKDYDKSLVGKAAKFGDKVAKSKVFDNDVTKSIGKYWHKGVDGTKKFLQKSQLYRAATETPIHPEWSMVKAMAYNCEQEVEQEFVRIMEILKIAPQKDKDMAGLSGEVMSFNELGLDKKEKEMLGKLGKITEEEAINRVLLKRLGVSEGEIETIVKSNDATVQVKNKILETLGLTFEDIKKIKADTTGAEIKKVLDACQKAGNKIHVGQGHYALLGIFTKPFERNISTSGVGNKLHSLGDGAQTDFGRFMSKFVQQTYRGFTFNQGKLGLLIFIAPGLVRAMIDTKKADKDKKVGTAAWGILETLIWVVTFPLSIKLLYGLGGMRFAGMTKEQVEASRKIKAEFNERVLKGELKEETAYKNARKLAEKEVKKLEKVESQSLFTKIIRKIVKPLSRDLKTETFLARQSGDKFMDALRKLPHFGANVVGVPLKFILGSMVFVGMFDSIIKKGCNKIFGKNYDSSVEEEHQQKLKEQEKFTREDLQNRLLEAQKNKLAGVNPDTENNENLDEKFATAVDMINQEPVTQTKKPQKQAELQQEAQTQSDIQGESQQEQQVVQSEIQPEMQTEVQPEVQQETLNVNDIPNNSQEKIMGYMLPNQKSEALKEENVDNQLQNKDDYTYIPSQDSTIQSQVEDIKKRYIPSQDNVIKNKEEQGEGQYIPSQKNSVKTSYDTPNFDKAFSRAARAEQNALQILAGNFPE